MHESQFKCIRCIVRWFFPVLYGIPHIMGLQYCIMNIFKVDSSLRIIHHIYYPTWQ